MISKSAVWNAQFLEDEKTQAVEWFYTVIDLKLKSFDQEDTILRLRQAGKVGQCGRSRPTLTNIRRAIFVSC